MVLRLLQLARDNEGAVVEIKGWVLCRSSGS